MVSLYYKWVYFTCIGLNSLLSCLVPVFSCEKALNIKKIIKIKGLGLGCSSSSSIVMAIPFQMYLAGAKKSKLKYNC
jgi:hypothetical protein